MQNSVINVWGLHVLNETVFVSKIKQNIYLNLGSPALRAQSPNHWTTSQVPPVLEI